MEKVEQVEEFLKEAGIYYLATVEGDQPRVRPFGAIHIFEGKLYIQSLLDEYTSLQNLYSADDDKTEVFYFRNAAVVISSFEHDPIRFRF